MDQDDCAPAAAQDQTELQQQQESQDSQDSQDSEVSKRRHKGRFMTQKQRDRLQKMRDGIRRSRSSMKQESGSETEQSTEIKEEPREYTTRSRLRAGEVPRLRPAPPQLQQTQQQQRTDSPRPYNRRAPRQQQPVVVKKELTQLEHYCHACQETLASEDIADALKNTAKTVLSVRCRHCLEINSVLTGERPNKPAAAAAAQGEHASLFFIKYRVLHGIIFVD